MNEEQLTSLRILALEKALKLVKDDSTTESVLSDTVVFYNYIVGEAAAEATTEVA